MAEEWMSRLQCRSSIAGAVVVIALFSSRPADAQVGIDPGPPRECQDLGNRLITGAQYDIINQKLAVKQLEKMRAKLSYDSQAGDIAAVEHDKRRIGNLEYRIAMDEWLIRWNLRQYPNFYTIRTDPVSCAAIAQATHTIPRPYPPQYAPLSMPGILSPTPMSSDSKVPVTIINAESNGAGIAFAIDGVAHQAAAGTRQELTVSLDSKITYDGGGSLGQRRYQITPGIYEFRSTPAGWAFYKLSGVIETAKALSAEEAEADSSRPR